MFPEHVKKRIPASGNTSYSRGTLPETGIPALITGVFSAPQLKKELVNKSCNFFVLNSSEPDSARSFRLIKILMCLFMFVCSCLILNILFLVEGQSLPLREDRL